MERDLIARHISHVKELRLLCPMEEVWSMCIALQDTPTPLLETFSLSYSNISDSDRDAANMPSHLFRCKMPKLICLSFHGCMLPRDPKIFTSTITCVQLSYPAQFNIGLPTQDELLGALRRMPALQELVLKHCLLQFLSTQDLMSPPAVEFNDLRSMVLVDDLHRCLAFICSVGIPIDATVDLSCSVANLIVNDIFYEFAKAGKLFSSARPFLALTIGVSKEGECVRIQGWTHLSDSDASTIGDGPPSFSITLGFERDIMPVHFVLLLQICHPMPLRDLRILSVRLDASQISGLGSFWDKQHWGLLFKNCLAVRHIIVSQSVAPLLLGSLQEYVVALPGDFQPGRRSGFGHLQTLSIDFIDPHEDNTLDALFPTELAEALAFAQSDGSMGPISIHISEWEDLEIWRKEHKSVHPLPKQRHFQEGSFWKKFNEMVSRKLSL
ncbi:hypothetical protein EWM64_g747 [Hericium alpestre]|uniref:F-box domain-containing protein n=1 Tax=Hericium alpestre TaxID=135208 RepID=A0A4Z0AAJ2_9AGAM|nr:hypothetical protein EWM64_g747 [Hericium alpestre]